MRRLPAAPTRTHRHTCHSHLTSQPEAPQPYHLAQSMHVGWGRVVQHHPAVGVGVGFTGRRRRPSPPAALPPRTANQHGAPLQPASLRHSQPLPHAPSMHVGGQRRTLHNRGCGIGVTGRRWRRRRLRSTADPTAAPPASLPSPPLPLPPCRSTLGVVCKRWMGPEVGMAGRTDSGWRSDPPPPWPPTVALALKACRRSVLSMYNIDVTETCRHSGVWRLRRVSTPNGGAPKVEQRRQQSSRAIDSCCF